MPKPVKQLWNVAMHVMYMYNLWVVFINTTAQHLGQISSYLRALYLNNCRLLPIRKIVVLFTKPLLSQGTMILLFITFQDMCQRFKINFGLCLWLSWYSCCFRRQRSVGHIQSSANSYWTFVYNQLFWKDKNEEKEAGNGPFKKDFEPTQFRKVVLTNY